MWCKGCQQERPVTDFRKNPRLKRGYESKCRKCDTERRIALRHKRRAEKAAADEAAAALPPGLADAIATHLRTTGCQVCHGNHPWTALRITFIAPFRRGEYQAPNLDEYTPAKLPALWRSVMIVCGDCLAPALAPARWLPTARNTHEPVDDTAFETDERARRLS